MDTETKFFWWCRCPRVNSIMTYTCAACQTTSRDEYCRNATHDEVLDELGEEIVTFAWDYRDERKSTWTAAHWLSYSRALTKYVQFLLDAGMLAENPSSTVDNVVDRHKYVLTPTFHHWFETSDVNDDAYAIYKRRHE